MLIERSLDSGIGADLYISQHKEMAEDFRLYCYASCWFQSTYESEAMWQLYSDKNKGIAIVTTVEKLKSILPKNTKVKPVVYVDFEAKNIEEAALPFYKRIAYEHEKELRAVVEDENSDYTGLSIQANPNSYIEKVVVSPMAQSWFFDVVRSCLLYTSPSPRDS